MAMRKFFGRNALKTAIASVTTLALAATLISPMHVSANTLTSTLTSQQSSTQKRNVMYYGDWSVWGGQGNFYVQNIPAEDLTHLNFAFMDFDAQGNLMFTDKGAALDVPMNQENITWGDVNAGILPAMVALRAKNPNLKIGLSLGGWSKGADFPLVANNEAALENFVEQVTKFIDYANFDFVDVDWEYPTSLRQPDLVDNARDEGTPYASDKDYELFPKLLQALRGGLDELGQKNNKYYELSVALHGNAAMIDKGVDYQVFDIIDFANLMNYDLAGAWDEMAGHQTPLYSNEDNDTHTQNFSIDYEVNHLISKGVDSEKIVIGSAFYTRGWEQVSNNGYDTTERPGLGGSAAIAGKNADNSDSRGALNEAPIKLGDGGYRGGIWGYRNIVENADGTYTIGDYTNLVRYWDDEAKAPYLYNGDVFFTYDDEQSVKEKANYVLENNLGGMISWQQSNDKPSVAGTDKRDTLTKAISSVLFGTNGTSENEITYRPVDISFDVSPYSEYGVDGYTITIQNNEELVETNEVLKGVELQAKTVTLPKLFVEVKDGVALTAGKYPSVTTTQSGGTAILDLSSVYNYKQLEPGESVEVNVKTNQSPANVEDILSVWMTQRITTDTTIATGAEMKHQTLYTSVITNAKPTITGAYNQTILKGEAFDPMKGVSALDKEDGELLVQVEGSVNVNEVGTYTLIYKAVDSEGLEVTKTVIITVKEEAKEEEKEEDTEEDTEDNTNEFGNFGVGTGTEWEQQVFAPFVDFVDWTTQEEYSMNGVPNLLRYAQDTGVYHYNLGFIQSSTSQTSTDKVDWAFGGYSVLNEANGTDNTQYQGMKKSIVDLRNNGGDVIISVGGLTGTSFWQVTTDVEKLANTYREIIHGFGLTRIDLDIEGSAQNVAQNTANAKALKMVQEETGVEVVLTLAVLPSGLTDGLPVVKAYLEQGVEISLVNLMTMCYGSATVDAGDDFGDASIKAVENTKNQLKAAYNEVGITLSDAELYKKLGTTPSIGFESESFPMYTTQMHEKVVEHAIQKELGMVSFWVLNRDAKTGGYAQNKGIETKYEFTDISKKFPTGVVDSNKVPILSGIEDAFIKVGDSFDYLAGISASDAEDGDITSAILIQGSVDTNTIGTYVLTYTVTDSMGKTAKAVRSVVVNESGINPAIPSWSIEGQNAGYAYGTLVIWKNAVWKQNQSGILWWGEPGVSSAWVKVKDLDGTEIIPNEAPKIIGAENVSILKGESFDVRDGVTATDVEDGDLTASITVTGSVNTQVAGNYTITYRVTDSKGIEATKTIVVTVNEPEESDPEDPNSGDSDESNSETPSSEVVQWDESSQAYTKDSVGSYRGGIYRATEQIWWGTPGVITAWERIGSDDSFVPAVTSWEQSNHYLPGDLVSYNGEVYKALADMWWSNTPDIAPTMWEKQ